MAVSRAEAWALFAILFLWQFPHFYSIAWLYRDDYSKAGIKMLPVVDETGERTARQILIYALILVPVSLLPTYFGMSGNLYLLGATLLSLTYLYYGFRITSERTPFRGAKSAADLDRVSAAAVRSDDGRPSSPVNRGICYSCGLAFFSRPAARVPRCPRYGVVPDFTLTDQSSRPFDSKKML